MSEQFALGRWSHREAAAYFPTAQEFADTMGDRLVGTINAPGGIAIWQGSGRPFERHELRDEFIAHQFPAPHHDFFTSLVNFQVPDDKVWDVLRLSGSVRYDPLKRELGARCGGLFANIATLTLATKIARGELSIEEVHAKRIYDAYIQQSKDPRALVAMLGTLTEVVAANTPTGGACWPLAFPGRCQ